MKAAVSAAVPSPCISVCQMHAASGWCQGCLRTLDEIATWGGLDDGAKRLVLKRIGTRRAAWRALQAPAGPARAEPGL